MAVSTPSIACRQDGACADRLAIRVELLAMFCWQGFMEAVPWSDAESDRYGGQIGAAAEVLVAVRVLREVLQAYLATNPQTGFPGVFDYEVSEPLGAWCRLSGPTHSPALKDEALRLVQAFFEPRSRSRLHQPPPPPPIHPTPPN